MSHPVMSFSLPPYLTVRKGLAEYKTSITDEVIKHARNAEDVLAGVYREFSERVAQAGFVIEGQPITDTQYNMFELKTHITIRAYVRKR